MGAGGFIRNPDNTFLTSDEIFDEVINFDENFMFVPAGGDAEDSILLAPWHYANMEINDDSDEELFTEDDDDIDYYPTDESLEVDDEDSDTDGAAPQGAEDQTDQPHIQVAGSSDSDSV